MSFFDWIAKIFSEYWRSFLRGTGNTLLMAIIGTIAGFIIGLVIAIIRTVPVKENAGGCFLEKSRNGNARSKKMMTAEIKIEITAIEIETYSGFIFLFLYFLF